MPRPSIAAIACSTKTASGTKPTAVAVPLTFAATQGRCGVFKVDSRGVAVTDIIFEWYFNGKHLAVDADGYIYELPG